MKKAKFHRKSWHLIDANDVKRNGFMQFFFLKAREKMQVKKWNLNKKSYR